MSVVNVVHVKKEPYAVYIGRPSKWGNPFIIGKDGDREKVLELYRNWFLSQPELIKDLPELDGKILGCWCKPQDCHGELLKDLLDLVEKKKNLGGE